MCSPDASASASPMVTASWNIRLSPPRYLWGAVSLRYRGTAELQWEERCGYRGERQRAVVSRRRWEAGRQAEQKVHGRECKIIYLAAPMPKPSRMRPVTSMARFTAPAFRPVPARWVGAGMGGRVSGRWESRGSGVAGAGWLSPVRPPLEAGGPRGASSMPLPPSPHTSAPIHPPIHPPIQIHASSPARKQMEAKSMVALRP